MHIFPNHPIEISHFHAKNFLLQALVYQFDALYWLIRRDMPFNALPSLKQLLEKVGVDAVKLQLERKYGGYDSTTVRQEMLQVRN